MFFRPKGYWLRDTIPGANRSSKSTEHGCSSPASVPPSSPPHCAGIGTPTPDGDRHRSDNRHVELPAPHAPEKGVPFLGRERQDRPRGMPAVAHADLAPDLAPGQGLLIQGEPGFGRSCGLLSVVLMFPSLVSASRGLSNNGTANGGSVRTASSEAVFSRSRPTGRRDSRGPGLAMGPGCCVTGRSRPRPADRRSAAIAGVTRRGSFHQGHFGYFPVTRCGPAGDAGRARFGG
jgi:hypothetical protein